MTEYGLLDDEKSSVVERSRNDTREAETTPENSKRPQRSRNDTN